MSKFTTFYLSEPSEGVYVLYDEPYTSVQKAGNKCKELDALLTNAERDKAELVETKRLLSDAKYCINKMIESDEAKDAEVARLREVIEATAERMEQKPFQPSPWLSQLAFYSTHRDDAAKYLRQALAPEEGENG